MSRCVLLGYPPWETVTEEPCSRTPETVLSNAGKTLAAARSTYRVKRSETTAQLMLERGGL